MAGSETEIVNSALIKVGAATILSLSDDSKAARIATKQYPLIRDELLRDHIWNFALKRVEMIALTAKPVKIGPEEDFTFQFQLPNDFIRFVLSDIIDPEFFQIEGDKLLAFVENIKMKYIYQVTDVSRFDSMFSEVLAMKLAADFALSLIQSTSLASGMLNLAEKKLKDARSVDAQSQGRSRQFTASEWFNARF